MAAISLFWDTNMAVKSCENTYSVCEWFMWSPFRERSRNGLRIRILPIRLFPTRQLSFFKKHAPPCEDNTEIIRCCTKVKTDCKKIKLIKNFNENKLEKRDLKILPLIEELRSS